MRQITAVVSVAAVVLMTSGVVAQVKPSFAGEWKMVVARGQGEPGVDLIITQDATTMTVDYVRGQAPAPAKLTYKLDGSVSRSPGSSRGSAAAESRAIWAGNRLVVTTTTGAGEEKRTFSIDSGYLVVETSAPARNGGAPILTKAIYQPYVLGFGG